MQRIGRFVFALLLITASVATTACKDMTAPEENYDVVLPTIMGYYGGELNENNEVEIYFDAPASWPAEIKVSKPTDPQLVIVKQNLSKEPFQSAFGGRVNYVFTLTYKLSGSRMGCVDLTPRSSPNGSTQICFQGYVSFGEKGILITSS